MNNSSVKNKGINQERIYKAEDYEHKINSIIQSVSEIESRYQGTKRLLSPKQVTTDIPLFPQGVSSKLNKTMFSGGGRRKGKSINNVYH